MASLSPPAPALSGDEGVFEKLTASAIFRGESVEGTLGTVLGSGSFLTELSHRTLRLPTGCCAYGGNARVGNLKAKFGR